MSLFPWTRHFLVPVATSSRQRTSTRIGYAIDIRVQRVVPKGLLPGRGGVLLLGVRQDEDAVQVHDHMPTRVRCRFTGQPPDTFAHFGAGDAQRGQDPLPAPPC